MSRCVVSLTMCFPAIGLSCDLSCPYGLHEACGTSTFNVVHQEQENGFRPILEPEPPTSCPGLRYGSLQRLYLTLGDLWSVVVRMDAPVYSLSSVSPPSRHYYDVDLRTACCQACGPLSRSCISCWTMEAPGHALCYICISLNHNARH